MAVFGKIITKARRHEGTKRRAERVPASGAGDVDQGLAEIRVTFDQEMVGGGGGGSGRPVRHELGNGVAVVVPSWRVLRLDGSCIEGEGLGPDVEVKGGDFSTRDGVLERALE